MFGYDDDLLAVTLVNENCSPEWKIYAGRLDNGDYRVQQTQTARTLEQCKYACVFNRRCVGITWSSSRVQCFLHSNLRYFLERHSSYNLYKLVRRCNITAGSFFIEHNVYFSVRILSEGWGLNLSSLFNPPYTA